MKKLLEINLKKVSCGISLFLTTCFLSGCNSVSVTDKAPKVTIAEYQKNIYQTTTVQSGTIEPMLSLTLTPDEFEMNSYSVDAEEMLRVSEINVEEGSHVEEGQVMVTFQNDGLEQQIAEYEERKKEDNLLIEHYTKLSKIDSEQDYSKDIKDLKADIAITDAYIAETKAELSNYQLIAKRAGTVTKIEEQLKQGYAWGGETLIRVVSGSSNYITNTSDDYAFQVGDIYEASFNLAVYEMKVIAIEEVEGKRQITFEPVSDMTGVSEQDKLSMEIAKTPITNAVYVEKTAIQTVDDVDYAFLIDEKGYRHAVSVTVKEIVDDYAIIADGLAEGEQVTVN